MNTGATRPLKRVTQGTLKAHMPVVKSLSSIPHLYVTNMHTNNHKWRSDTLQHFPYHLATN